MTFRDPAVQTEQPPIGASPKAHDISGLLAGLLQQISPLAARSLDLPALFGLDITRGFYGATPPAPPPRPRCDG